MEARKSAGCDQVVRVYNLENRLVVEQVVAAADRESGLQRLNGGDFDFVRVIYGVPIAAQFTITDKRLWELTARVTHLTTYQQNLYQLAKRVITAPDQRAGVTQLTNVSNKVIQLNKNTYNHIFPPIGWFVTPKLDGQHGVVMNLQMDGGMRAVLLGGETTLLSKPSSQRKQFAVEVEILGSELWIIDVMVPWDYEGQSRAHIAERVKSFPQYVGLIQALVGGKYQVFAKPYWDIKQAVVGGAKRSKRPKRVGGILKALEKELGGMIDASISRQVPVVGFLERDDESAERIFRDVRKFVDGRVRELGDLGADQRSELMSEAKTYAEAIAGSVAKETDTPA